MPGDATPWDPNDWEQHIQKVLKLRYAQPVGRYQHIPAEIKGDCGIEGFATTVQRTNATHVKTGTISASSSTTKKTR